MNQEIVLEQFFETLISGDRQAARQVVQDTAKEGATPETLITELFWPAYEMIERLYRGDQLTEMSHHLAARLLRVLVDQTAAQLKTPTARNRTVFAFCGPSEGEELGAQMAVDLLEAGGFSVRFAGGGVPNDEIMAQLHEHKPDVLLMFSSAAQDLPNIRELVDRIREIGACPNLQVVVGGGVFNRAEGLAEEIGADLWATSPLELVELLKTEPQRRANTAEQRTVGRKRTRKAA
jgi:methanogenic corrinoid protein MtbC1